MPSEVLSTVMKSLASVGLPAFASGHGRQKLQGSPCRSVWSWESPVVEWISAQTPVRREQALRDFALKTIGKGSAGAGGEESSNLPINVSLTRQHKGVEEAPQDGRLLGDIACWSSLNKNAEIFLMYRVTHGRPPLKSMVE
jgi:hypothetical protein